MERVRRGKLRRQLQLLRMAAGDYREDQVCGEEIDLRRLTDVGKS